MKSLFVTAALAFLLANSVNINLKAEPTVTSIRAFEEPLVAINGDNTANHDSALTLALEQFQQRKNYEDVSALTNYLNANAHSPWRFSLLANLGIIYRKTGYYSKAIDSWEEAWKLGKGEKDLHVQALSNRVVADLVTLLASLGRSERIDPLLSEMKGRQVYGSSMTELKAAHENLWLMKNKPEDSFKCGPYALDSIKTFLDPRSTHDRKITDAKSTGKGFSLIEVRNLSNSLKMNYQMAKRIAHSDFIVPSVIHWKSGHYAALIKKVGDHYLVKDPTFGSETLLSSDALENESSGNFLVPSGKLPTGWEVIRDAEGKTIFGRGLVAARVPTATKKNDKKCPCQGGGSNGMAVYSMLAMLVSLSIEDTPVGYTPPVGPDMHFTITYNQMEAGQPSTFSYFNFGPSWNCAWLSYVTVPTYAGGSTTVNVRGGGQEIYTTYNSTGTTYAGYVGYYGFELQSQATLWVTTSGTYERRLPDGSKEVFGQVDPSGIVFLSEIVDPKGNTNSLSYDSNFRLTTISDGAGLQTTVTYGLSPTTPDPSNPLTYLITKVTDPYGRFASFSYSSSAPYQLTGITDVVGITSNFTYGTGSVITQMVTPYGTTTFAASAGNDNTAVRSLRVTEPDSSEVYAESRIDGSNFPTIAGDDVAPPAIPLGGAAGSGGDERAPELLLYRNTYYWDKKAMQATSNNPDSDYTKAYIYHFIHNQGRSAEAPVLESEKPPLESRIWYAYPGQAIASFDISTSDKPTVIARNLDSGSQAWHYQYSSTANPAAVTVAIDPMGRQTNYSYSSNGIDLTGITQNTASGTDTLSTITYDDLVNPPHCPVTMTDAAGKTTSYTYNSQGQVLTITPPARSGHGSETTTYSYSGNFLTSVTGPLTGATKTYTYDTLNSQSLNRIKTVTDAESYTRTFSYDNLDRVTQIAYPDGTTEAFSYLNPTTSAVDLDLHSSTDRLGRTTTRTYDSTRHLISVTDPLSRTTSYGWCSCGAMISMTDPKGNITYFNRDLESRLTSKVYPGGTQPPSTPDYTYDTVGRVATYKDKRADTATYTYNLDNTLSGVSYSLASGTAATPSVALAYDSNYNRPTSVGGIALAYNAVGSLGALKPSTITNTLTGGSAAIAYTYDEWGRVVGSNIDSSNSQTTVFDSLGRVTSVTNLLGSFTYGYFDPTHPTDRVGSISYPNGQSTSYNYYGNNQDERLSEIANVKSGGGALSKDDYTYDAMGKILTWQQQTDGTTPLVWTEGYDAADQLTSAVQTNSAISSPAVRSNSYGYDTAGNLTSSSLSGVSRSPSYNALNQLTGSTPSGSQSVRFTGSLDLSATVTINGSAATVSGTNFTGAVSLTPGSTNTVSVVAQDAHGNIRTNDYQTIIPPQLTYTPTYDADGNELTNGAGQTYTWDAKNELASITYTGGASSLFTYDALGRRIAIVEKNSGGTVTSTKQLVWDGERPVEERNVSNTVTKRFFAQGEQISGTSYFYTKDHLGSVREMTDSSGTIQARYDYDPYGKVTKLAGSLDADFQYDGYYEHAASGLNLTLFRAYDPNVGKWLSRDPIAERGGINLYDYVGNNPIDRIDPLGLCPCGQHAEFVFEDMAKTRDKFLLNESVPAGGLATEGVAQFGKGAAKVGASKISPVITAYELGIDIGSFLGAWKCVSNDTYGSDGTHFWTDGNGVSYNVTPDPKYPLGSIGNPYPPGDPHAPVPSQ
jgi:RHS repeat-associated protein